MNQNVDYMFIWNLFLFYRKWSTCSTLSSSITSCDLSDVSFLGHSVLKYNLPQSKDTITTPSDSSMEVSNGKGKQSSEEDITEIGSKKDVQERYPVNLHFKGVCFGM